MRRVVVAILFLPLQVISTEFARTNCPIIVDGRIPPFAKTSDFDTPNIPYKGGVKPSMSSWESILSFPKVQPSLFDRDSGAKSVEVHLSDKSIVSIQNQLQTDYRRSELVLEDKSDAGVKTYHWSVRQGNWLNLAHFYTNVFVDKGDAQGENFALVLGDLKGTTNWMWKISGHDRRIVWETIMYQNEWQNFAVTLDYDRKYVARP
jgi:hypothetical protein